MQETPQDDADLRQRRQDVGIDQPGARRHLPTERQRGDDQRLAAAHAP